MTTQELNHQLKVFRILSEEYRKLRRDQLIAFTSVELCNTGTKNRIQLAQIFQLSTAHVQGYRAAMEKALEALGGLNARETMDDLDTKTWNERQANIELTEAMAQRAEHEELGRGKPELRVIDGGKDND